MPVKANEDPVLTNLRASWQSKHDEAQAIISDPASTGEKLVKAEKLFDERDRIGDQIEGRQADLTRVESLKSRYSGGDQWSREPHRTLPFSGGSSGVHDVKRYGNSGEGQLRYGGFEPAGHTDLAYNDERKRWEAVSEAGPGTFGEQKWELLNSFEYKKDWALYLRKGQRMIDLCQKTLFEGQDDQGGVFSPAEFYARIISRLPAPTSLRGLVTTLTTGRDMLLMPRTQYSADDIYSTAFRVNWTGESPADGTGAQAAVDDTKLTGNVEIPVHTAMLNGSFTKNIFEDSAFPIQSWLEGKFQEAVDICYEDMILNGSGIGQPSGILLGAASGNNGTTTNPNMPEVVLSSTSGNIDYGQLIDLQTAVAPQYERNSRWVMNKKSTYRALNKLVDLQNRPIFTDGYNDSGLVGARGKIMLGDPITLSQLMPSIVSTTSFPIIYGDLMGHYLAQRIGFSLQVLDQTKAKINQIELVGRLRFGGKTIEGWRLKIGKAHSS